MFHVQVKLSPSTHKCSIFKVIFLSAWKIYLNTVRLKYFNLKYICESQSAKTGPMEQLAE